MGSGISGYRGTFSGNGTTGSKDDGYRKVRGFSTKLHLGAQGKHIPGHNNYNPNLGRSIVHGGMARAQRLINEFAGTGAWHGTNKETVDFGIVIGTWVSPDGSRRLSTTRGTIHYGKHGAHIVPAAPRGC